MALLWLFRFIRTHQWDRHPVASSRDRKPIDLAPVEVLQMSYQRTSFYMCIACFYYIRWWRTGFRISQRIQNRKFLNDFKRIRFNLNILSFFHSFVHFFLSFDSKLMLPFFTVNELKCFHLGFQLPLLYS